MQDSTRIALRAERLSKTFGGVVAVHDVSFELAENSIVGLIGPNGSGKTTLVNVLSGVLPPTGGSVFLGDREVTHLPVHKIFRLGIARTFQNMRLFSEMSVYENLETAAIAVHDRKHARAQVERLLDELGLSAHAYTDAGTLPYGLQKLTSLGRALAANPRFLLLDEPAAGLNDAETADLVETIQRIRDSSSAGVLLIDHDLRLIMGVCERVLVLTDGRKISEGPPEQVRNDPAVIKAYLG